MPPDYIGHLLRLVVAADVTYELLSPTLPLLLKPSVKSKNTRTAYAIFFTKTILPFVHPTRYLQSGAVACCKASVDQISVVPRMKFREFWSPEVL
jgi:hypothetical protein